MEQQTTQFEPGRFRRKVWGEADNSALQNALRLMAEESYREFHSSLTPTAFSILGVRMPRLKALAREIVSGGWESYLSCMENGSHDGCKAYCYEEVMLRGLVIGVATARPESDLAETQRLIADFVPLIDNWAVNDFFVSSLKQIGLRRAEYWDFLTDYLAAQGEFEVRFGVTALMTYYITEESVVRLLPLLNGIHRPEYYVRMAVAWALSMCYVKFPDITLPILERSSLDDWTYNKTLQKILESRQANQEQKQLIRSMKRK